MDTTDRDQRYKEIEQRRRQREYDRARHENFARQQLEDEKYSFKLKQQQLIATRHNEIVAGQPTEDILVRYPGMDTCCEVVLTSGEKINQILDWYGPHGVVFTPYKFPLDGGDGEPTARVFIPYSQIKSITEILDS